MRQVILDYAVHWSHDLRDYQGNMEIVILAVGKTKAMFNFLISDVKFVRTDPYAEVFELFSI